MNQDIFKQPEDSIGIFSAECTIGMVWGLSALKDYGNNALWHYGNKV